jgi:hypothetical protein
MLKMTRKEREKGGQPRRRRRRRRTNHKTHSLFLFLAAAPTAMANKIL